MAGAQRGRPARRGLRALARLPGTARDREPHLRPLHPYTVGDLAGGLTDIDFCLHWPALDRDAPAPPGSALPDVPVLAVGGDFDTMRPREVAEAVRAFPRGSFLRIPFGAHSLTTGGGEVHACVRGVLRDFLAGRVSGCTAENHRVPGAFPRSYEDITDVPAAGLNGRRRRLLGGAFATAADAVARRNPLTAPPAASG